MLAVLAGLLVLASAARSETVRISANYLDRLEQFARLQTLNADLLSHASATAVLQATCERLDPTKPRITARTLPAAADPVSESAARTDLGLGPEAPLRYRRVELACGAVVLSRAENWYAPDRLTPEMNATLEATPTPFGVAVKALNFRRQTLSATLLYQPLPSGWEALPPPRRSPPADPPRDVLRHRAVLTTGAGQPFSLVVETYSRDAIARGGQPPPTRDR